MKASWNSFKLSELASKITDGSHNPPKGVEFSEYIMLSSRNVYDDEFHYESPRYLSEENYKQENKRTQIAAGDVLLTIVGTIGRVAVVPTDAPFITLQRSVAVIKPIKDKVIPRFLMYHLIQQSAQLNELARGVAQKGIYLETLRQIEISAPSITEQQRIVAKLDQAFEGIAKARANAEQNLQNARALFESHLQSVFNQRGEGWVEKTLSAVCEIKPPKSEAKKLLKNSDLVSFAPMEDLGINQKYLKPKKQRTLEDVAGSYTYFAEGDVLLAKITPCFENGKLGIAKNLINGIGFGSSEYIVFRPNKELSNEFLYYFLSRKRFIEEGAVRMSGAVGHKRVSKEFIEEYKVAFPSLDTQNMMVKKIDNLSKETQRLETLYQRKINLLDELKKSLLQQAFAGEL